MGGGVVFIKIIRDRKEQLCFPGVLWGSLLEHIFPKGQVDSEKLLNPYLKIFELSFTNVFRQTNVVSTLRFYCVWLSCRFLFRLFRFASSIAGMS